MPFCSRVEGSPSSFIFPGKSSVALGGVGSPGRRHQAHEVPVSYIQAKPEEAFGRVGSSSSNVYPGERGHLARGFGWDVPRDVGIAFPLKMKNHCLRFRIAEWYPDFSRGPSGIMTYVM